jgi:glycosyltransferase involved in cell wall biosynthesis
MKIAAVTPLFPTACEPYRGAPIWRTLARLSRRAEVRAYCPLPRYPLRLRPRSFRHHGDDVDPSAYGIAARTVEYAAVPVLSRPFNGAAIRRGLRRLFEQDRPDVILSYWVHPEGYAAVRVGREMNLPVLVGSRGSDLNQRDRLTERQLRFTLRHADGVLCVSSELARKAAEIGAAPQNVHTIRNGVDTEVFRYGGRAEARARLCLPEAAPWALFVGWLSELKGAPQLLDAIARLNRAGTPWNVALVGEGYLEAALRKSAGETGIGGRTRFLGPLAAPQVADWMNACDALCLPSRMEGCPNVVVEALSCGLPVVATAVGGIPELVDASSAVLIPEPDPALLADALQRASEIRWDREAIAKSRQRSWDQVAEETYSVCRQAAGKS